MPRERKIQREDAEALARDLRKAFGSVEDRVSVPWFERSLVLERVSGDEFLVRQSDVAVTGRLILASGAKPADYPPDLPYVPDEVVMLGPQTGHTVATWWSTGDLPSLLAELERQCAAAGWARQAEAPPTHEEVTLRVYEKAGMRRHIMLSQGIVSLIEMKGERRVGTG